MNELTVKSSERYAIVAAAMVYFIYINLNYISSIAGNKILVPLLFLSLGSVIFSSY